MFSRWRLNFFLAVVLVAVGCTPRLRAEGSPPLITDDPGTPGNGRWEIDVGVSTERRSGVQVSELPLLDVAYGLGDSVELNAELPFLVEHEEGQSQLSGFGRSAVSVKWRFHDTGEGGLALSVYPRYEFKTPGSSSDSRGLIESGSAFRLPVQLEKGLGPVTLNLQFGREFRAAGDSWFYGAALSHRVNGKFEFAVELAGGAAARLDRSQLVLDFGFVVDLSERDSLMFSVGRELHNHDEARASFVGYLGWQFRR
jgi:hypothetical protein